MDYKGGTTNDARAQANPDRYNPQFLPDETYFDVWGDDYREWFRLQANKRRREDEKKKTNGAKRKRNGGEKHNLEVRMTKEDNAWFKQMSREIVRSQSPIEN